jgi:hypothetical protein
MGEPQDERHGGRETPDDQPASDQPDELWTPLPPPPPRSQRSYVGRRPWGIAGIMLAFVLAFGFGLVVLGLIAAFLSSLSFTGSNK